MGMFDYVDIEYDLPMPENATEEQIPFIKQGIKANHFQMLYLIAAQYN